MKIPQIITSYVSKELGTYYSVSYLGKRDTSLFFTAFIDNAETGFPKVLILDTTNNEISTFGDFIALDIIASFKRV